MTVYRLFCTCLLMLGVSQSANATGGAVNLTLDQLFKEYEVQSVLIGEVRGFERSQVNGSEPQDASNADEAHFHQYSYTEIKFRVVPQKALRGTTEIGKPVSLIFKERDFSGVVTLKKDGTVGYWADSAGNHQHRIWKRKKEPILSTRQEGRLFHR